MKGKNKQLIIKLLICLIILLFILFILTILTYYFNQWFLNTFSSDVLMGGVTIFGIGFAYYEHTKSMRIKQQERAVHIAEVFSKHLITDLSLINQIIDNTEKLSQIVDDLPNDELIFTQDFLVDMIGEKKVNQYMEVISSSEINNAFKEYYQSSQIDNLRFVNFILSFLNELEVLCMDITSNAAGSEYIYPILHQSFLPSIKRLCIIIAHKNSNYSDRFYPNIAQTYNQWIKIRNDDLKKERRTALKRQTTI